VLTEANQRLSLTIRLMAACRSPISRLRIDCAKHSASGLRSLKVIEASAPPIFSIITAGERHTPRKPTDQRLHEVVEDLAGEAVARPQQRERIRRDRSAPPL